ncbi:unnamed protein product [Amoebophrya sp. A120]|nr:unnamed protein product [Amoebophrya sp. A120]|eukprot:GSA120T00004413001.1
MRRFIPFLRVLRKVLPVCTKRTAALAGFASLVLLELLVIRSHVAVDVIFNNLDGALVRRNAEFLQTHLQWYNYKKGPSPIMASSTTSESSPSTSPLSSTKNVYISALGDNAAHKGAGRTTARRIEDGDASIGSVLVEEPDRFRLRETVVNQEKQFPPDFEVHILAYNRAKPLQRLLHSLSRAVYAKADRVDVVLHCEGEEPNEKILEVFHKWTWPPSRSTSRAATAAAATSSPTSSPSPPSPTSAKRVVPNYAQRGLSRSWYGAWYPRDKNLHVLILEDDLEVAPMFYLWLKKAWKVYGDTANGFARLFGICLNKQGMVPLSTDKTVRKNANFVGINGTGGVLRDVRKGDVALDDADLIYDEEVGVGGAEASVVRADSEQDSEAERRPSNDAITTLRAMMRKHPRGGLPFLYRQLGTQGFSPHPVWWKVFLHWMHEELPPLIPHSRTESFWDGLLYRNHYPLKWWFWPVRMFLLLFGSGPKVTLEKPPNIPTIDGKKIGLVTSGWWADSGYNMWEQHVSYFVADRDLFFLYLDLFDESGLVTHWREKGTHYGSSTNVGVGVMQWPLNNATSLVTDHGGDFDLSLFPRKIPRLDWDGKPMKKVKESEKSRISSGGEVSRTTAAAGDGRVVVQVVDVELKKTDEMEGKNGDIKTKLQVVTSALKDGRPVVVWFHSSAGTNKASSETIARLSAGVLHDDVDAHNKKSVVNANSAPSPGSSSGAQVVVRGEDEVKEKKFIFDAAVLEQTANSASEVRITEFAVLLRSTARAYAVWSELLHRVQTHFRRNPLCPWRIAEELRYLLQVNFAGVLAQVVKPP